MDSTGANSALELSANVNGFTATTRSASGSGWGTVGYLAIKFGTAHQMELVSYDIPTTTGTNATTGVGFQPDYLIGIQSMVTALNSDASDNTATSFSVGMSDGTDEATVGFKFRDATTPTESDSFWNSTFHQTEEGSSAGDSIATVSSFDSDGFTLNWSSIVNTSTAKSLAWALTTDVALIPETVASAQAIALEPTISATGPDLLTPSEAATSASAQQPKLAIGLQAPAAEAVSSALAPKLSIGLQVLTPEVNASAQLGALSVGLQAPVSSASSSSERPSLSIGLQGPVSTGASSAQAPSLGIGLQAPASSTASEALAPSISASGGFDVINAPVATVSVSAPAVSFGVFATLLARTASVAAQAEQASLAAAFTLEAEVASAAASALQPTVFASFSLRAGKAVVAAAAQSAIIPGTVRLAAPVASVSAVAESALIDAPKILSAGVASISAVALEPSVDNTARLQPSVASVNSLALAPKLAIKLLATESSVRVFALGAGLSTPGGPVQLQTGVGSIRVGALTATIVRPGGLLASRRAETSAPYWSKGQITAPGFGRMEVTAPYWGKSQNNGG